MRQRLHGWRIALVVLGLTGQPGQAQDKSGSRAGLAKAPTASSGFAKDGALVGTSGNKGTNEFTLPLPELPVRDGQGPDLQLSYDQQGRNHGQGLGMGWSIQTPAIVVSTELGLPIPGFRRNGNFMNNLLLAGEKLQFIRSDGDVTSFKVRAHEQDLVINYYRDGYLAPEAKTIATDGPLGDVYPAMNAGFEVIYPNGTRQLYSGELPIAEGFSRGQDTAISRFPLIFEISPKGETVSYHYTKVGGRSYLSDVYFAGGKSHYRFELSPTSHSAVSHGLAFPQQNAMLYTKLLTEFKGQPQEQWCFVYLGDRDSATGKRTIKTHKDCQDAATDELALAAQSPSLSAEDQLQLIYRYGKQPKYTVTTAQQATLRFGYSSWDAGSLAGRDIVYSLSSLTDEVDFSAKGYELADINHDGMIDVIHRQKLDGQSRYFQGLGGQGQFFGPPQHWTVQGDGREVSPNLNSNDFHFADLNGDTFVDILQWDKEQAVVYLGQAGGTFLYAGVHHPEGNRQPTLNAGFFEGGKAQFIDLDADGKSDILAAIKGDDNQTIWKVYLNASTAGSSGWKLEFAESTFRFPMPQSDLKLSDMRITDFNSDGLPDLTWIQPSIADRLPGLCVYVNMGRIYQIGSSDPLFGPNQLDATCGNGGTWIALNGLPSGQSNERLWYVDANGDGLTDVAALSENNTTLLLWLGNGGLHLDKHPVSVSLNRSVPILAGGNVQSRIADVDGDGQDEILIFNEGASADSKALLIDFNRTKVTNAATGSTNAFHLIRSNLLTSVEHDDGLRFDMRYATAATERMRDQRLGETTSPLHFPIYVLKQLVQSIRIPGTERQQTEIQEFFYQEPYFSAEDREFLGFSRVGVLRYGEQFAGESSFTLTAYHTGSTQAAARRLAGKPKYEHLFQTSLDTFFEEQGKIDRNFDASDPRSHSLLNYSAEQKLPSRKITEAKSWTWETEERDNQTFFTRLVREEEQIYDPQFGIMTAQAATRSTSYFDFDPFNMPTRIVEEEAALSAPKGVTLPASSTETVLNYDESRDQLAHLRILDLVSTKLILRNGKVLADETYAYDGKGQLTATTNVVWSQYPGEFLDLEGKREWTRTVSSAMEYDDHGNVKLLRDDQGVIEEAEYDGDGLFLRKLTRPAPRPGAKDFVALYEYEGMDLKKETDPRGLETTYDYDDLGRLESMEIGADHKETFQYRDARGLNPRMVLHESPKDKNDAGLGKLAELLIYRADGQLLAHLRDVLDDGKAAIRVQSLQDYDRNGRPIFLWTPYTLPRSAGTHVADLMQGDLSFLKSPYINGEKIAYDYQGRLQQRLTAEGKTTSVQYFPWGVQTATSYQQKDRTVTSTHSQMENGTGIHAQITSYPGGPDRAIHYQYDDLGLLSTIQKSEDEGKVRRVWYNTAGDLEAQDVPGIGRIFSIHDSRGQETDRLRVSVDGKEQHHLQWTYDAIGRVTAQHLDGQLHVENSYDQDPTATTWQPHYKNGQGSLHGLLAQARTFDISNKLFDRVERLRYDPMGLITSREIKLGQKTFIEDYLYHDDGSLREMRDPAGVVTHYAYDSAAQLEGLAATIPGRDQQEPLVGNIQFNARSQFKSLDYLGFKRGFVRLEQEYDPKTLQMTHYQSSVMGRETGALLQNIQLEYDANEQLQGRLDLRKNPAKDHTATYSYNAREELTQAVTKGRTYSYDYNNEGDFDASGTSDPHMWSIEPANFLASAAGSYNGFRQLTRGVGLDRLVYDPAGQLVLVETPNNTLYFGYDHLGRRSYKRVVAKAGAAVTDFLFPTKSLTDTATGKESYTFVGKNRISSYHNGTGQRLYYLHDQMGSIETVVDSDAQVLEERQYSPYGVELQTDAKVPYGLTGHYNDRESQLVYMGFRYYDPRLGRFISPDPLYLQDPEKCQEEPLECTLDIYAFNNPINFLDENGLAAGKDGGRVHTSTGGSSGRGGTHTSLWRGAKARPHDPNFRRVQNMLKRQGLSRGNIVSQRRAVRRVDRHTYGSRASAKYGAVMTKDGISSRPGLDPGIDALASVHIKYQNNSRGDFKEAWRKIGRTDEKFNYQGKTYTKEHLVWHHLHDYKPGSGAPGDYGSGTMVLMFKHVHRSIGHAGGEHQARSYGAR